MIKIGDISPTLQGFIRPTLGIASQPVKRPEITRNKKYCNVVFKILAYTLNIAVSPYILLLPIVGLRDKDEVARRGRGRDREEPGEEGTRARS